MDVELEKMQFLGICGIFRETINLIQKWRKIFTQITLAFILPLSLLIFANFEISNFFVRKITHDKLVLQHTQKSTPKFQKLSDVVSSERIHYSLFNIAYFIFSTVFSLLSTSAVVYTVACIYTARDVSFKNVITVVPKVWKRLLVTFLCVLAALFAFNFAVFSVIFSILLIALLMHGASANDFSFGVGSVTIVLLFVVFYFVAVWYLTIIWQLSSVVSVLEGSCGFKAMAKSKALLKGKMATATILLLSLSLPFGTIQVVFNHQVIVRSASAGVVGRGIVGIIWFLSFLLIVLMKLVAGTVLYFVCKSYHHESVDKSALSDHLQGYLLADYVPLKVDDDVHLEKLQVV